MMDSSETEHELKAIHAALERPPTAEEITEDVTGACVTVQDAVRYSVSCFAAHQVFVGHGTDNYWDEALELAQAVMHLQPPCDESTLRSRLTRRELQLLAALLKLRIFARMPVPYLTQRAFFCGREFYVDRRVLIPRSPLAELIENRFNPYIDRPPARVLDLCTGSGCIAISIALQFDGETEVDAVDISQDAIAVCTRNIETYELEELVTPICSDLFDALPEGDRYDLIVANPPYVGSEELDALPEEYLHEPDIALRAGERGLELARRILRQASSYLSEAGVLIMEVGESEDALVDAYPQVPFHFVDLRRGGRGVFMLTCEQLRAFADMFDL